MSYSACKNCFYKWNHGPYNLAFSTQKIQILKIVNLVSQVEIYNVKYVIE